MVKRRVKKTATEPALHNVVEDTRQPEIEDKEVNLFKLEVERQSAAIRAMREMEIEHSLTALRLLRSYFTKEQLQTPALQFFRENFPNLSIDKNGENEEFEAQWKDKDGNSSMNQAGGRDMHTSLLHRMSIAYPDYSAPPSFCGFELSSKALRTSLLGADNLEMRDFVSEGASETQMLGMQDALRTPGVSSQRLSVGMTPKTLRLPKPGEMLLSVRGSPLGVFKDDNMEAIHESEEG